MTFLGAIIYLVAGSTVYLLMFKRSLMMSGKFMPKIFMACVTSFLVLTLWVSSPYFPVHLLQ